ncbi:Ig-like domain-containing protein [Pseudomonas sp. A-RE-19]|uniref:Ig-like domain-containing protein n=1 Tax=Pseudomonas sp. A-RE-19 TaxID=2832401 RepID=UPI001CC020EA|nr:Ig-like domain-containing protein [Pseudomonas sp. A-RE-19]
MTSLRPYLTPFSRIDISPMSLDPVLVTGMTRPIVDGDGGIGLGVVEDDPEGVFCVIDPWYRMQEGDTVDVYLDLVNVWSHEVTAQEVNQRLFFFVPKEQFVPGWIEQCFYRLQRKDETEPDAPSVTLRLLVKLDRPAGRDTDPHLPGHSHLKMVQLPKEVIEQGVDAEWAAKGVPMTIERYPNIALRDTVQVKWGSVYLKPLVLSQAHVDGTQPIEVVAEQADILAGGDSAALLVHYEVYDEVWNYSVEWSKTTTVKVDAGAWRLDAPIIDEAVDGKIDLIALNQQDVTVLIRVETDDFAIGDTITMTWIGTPKIGEPLINIQSHEITNIPSILKLYIPYEEVRAIAMGSADASYVLTKKDGSPPLSSKRTFANVVGDVYAYPAPVLREVLGDILEPDTMMATVDVSYPSMANGDYIELIWEGTRSDSSSYLHSEEHTVSQNDAERKLITLYIFGEHIDVLANGRLNLWYRVTNDEAAVYGVSESEHLLLKVQAITATLPAPKVPEANEEDVLDPSKIFEKVTVLVDYLGTVKEDILTCYWTGPNPFTSTSDWLPITTISAGKPISFRVDADFVTANIGDYVKVRYTLKHAATGLYSYSGTLNLLIGYLVGELPPPQLIQAVDDTLDPIKALDGVDIKVSYESMDPALDTVILKWLGTPGPGTSEDQEKPGDQSGTVMFHLDASFVGPNINRMVSVGYGVKRYGHVTPSQTLSLRVLEFQDPENQLPRPEVPQAVERVLDLMEFAGDPDVVVQKWPFIAPGQRLWLRLEGQAIGGTPHPIVLMDGVLITDGQVSNGLKQSLPRAELLKLVHSSSATVLCKVAFDGAAEESAAVEFPLLPLTVRTRYDYVTPDITDVLDSWGQVAEGGLTFDKQVTIKGIATRGEKVALFDGSTPQGEADVDKDGIWMRPLTHLTVKDYHVTAHALYDADPVSSLLRAFTVAEAVTPTIDRVTDSKGEVLHNGTTFDTSVTVTGKASPGQTVQLYDGSTPIAPVTPVDDSGKWSKTLTGLSVAPHNIKAKALYGTQPESEIRAFTVAEAVTPTIDRVTDSKGEVLHNGSTFDTSVTVTGKASPGQTVQLYDGSTPIAPVTPVDDSGKWSKTLTDLSVAPHNIKAKALYGTQPESEVRAFTVAVASAPIIECVTDSKGEVLHNGTTFDTSVTVTGKANPGQTVQLYDGSTPIAPVTPVDDSGKWSKTLTGLSVAPHNIKAKALYGTQPESEVRTFVVATHIAPRIDSVKGGGVEIPDNGETKSTTVTLRGIVTPNHQVQIYDNNVAKHTVTAVGTTWDTTLAVPVGSHSITAKALTTGQVSNTRRVRVLSSLTINTARVTLSGWIFRHDSTPTNPPAGSFVDRTANSGVPPYRYTSSNPGVAEVNVNTGRVISKGNGSAVITVTDATNQTASYPVSVSNVFYSFGLGSFGPYGLAAEAAAQHGGRIPSLAEWRSYINTYAGVATIARWVWSADRAGINTQWAIYPATGATQQYWDWFFNRQSADGFGIRPK